jgi:hypothetical protein
MSRIVIVILIYHCHKPIDLVYKHFSRPIIPNLMEMYLIVLQMNALIVKEIRPQLCVFASHEQSIGMSFHVPHMYWFVLDAYVLHHTRIEYKWQLSPHNGGWVVNAVTSPLGVILSIDDPTRPSYCGNRHHPPPAPRNPHRLLVEASRLTDPCVSRKVAQNLYPRRSHVRYYFLQNNITRKLVFVLRRCQMWVSVGTPAELPDDFIVSRTSSRWMLGE